MRSPVIAFSIIAAAAVSPTLVSAAPASPKLDNTIAQAEAITTHQLRQFPPDLPGISDIPDFPDVTDVPNVGLLGDSSPPPAQDIDDPVHRTQALRKAHMQTSEPGQDIRIPSPPHTKRASDGWTAGGNAYSGAASNAIGGDVDNFATHGGLNNHEGAAAGSGGNSFSGFTYGGDGGGKGPGGNAYSGATGSTDGGNLNNIADGNGSHQNKFTNDAPVKAGHGGLSESGTAVGGDAIRPGSSFGKHSRRAWDKGTAGGNAYSGSTSSASGGSIVNDAGSEGVLYNHQHSKPHGGPGGTSFSGDADGGKGLSYGPGGNAYTGATGPSNGGAVYNLGGEVNNQAASFGGDAGTSETGQAMGGSAALV